MNVIVSGERWGRGQKVMAYSDVIFTMLILFLFLCFGSGRSECNSFWEGRGRTEQIGYFNDLAVM